MWTATLHEANTDRLKKLVVHIEAAEAEIGLKTLGPTFSIMLFRVLC